jgi:hypothetical protein
VSVRLRDWGTRGEDVDVGLSSGITTGRGARADRATRGKGKGGEERERGVMGASLNQIDYQTRVQDYMCYD